MPSWKKVIISGSNALLNSLIVTSGSNFTGSFVNSGSFTQIGNEIITGSSTATLGYTGSLLGNASTVTNGVYTTGTYANPSWITNINYSILNGTVPTWNQNTTGTAYNITATSNSTLTTLSALSLPYSQLTGVPNLTQYVPYTGATGNVNLGSYNLTASYMLVSNNINAGGLGLTNSLYFGGVYGNSDNTDPIYMVKNDITSNLSSLDIFIGDDGSGTLIPAPSSTATDYLSIKATNDGIHHLFGSDGTYRAGGSISASIFYGQGTGLTGTAAGLSIGGTAAYATVWVNQGYLDTSHDANLNLMMGHNGSTGYWSYYGTSAIQSWLGLGSAAYQNTGNFILNQTSQQPSSNFNISGNGIIGGNLSINGGSLNLNTGTSTYFYNLSGNSSVRIWNDGGSLVSDLNINSPITVTSNTISGVFSNTTSSVGNTVVVNINRNIGSGTTSAVGNGLVFTDVNSWQASIVANRVASAYNYYSQLIFYTNSTNSSNASYAGLTQALLIDGSNNNLATFSGPVIAQQFSASTSVGQSFFVGRQSGGSYTYSDGIFKAISDNPTGSSNYFFQGLVNGSSGTTTYSVRADGQIYMYQSTGTTRSWTISPSSGNLNFSSGDSSGAFVFTAGNISSNSSIFINAGGLYIQNSSYNSYVGLTNTGASGYSILNINQPTVIGSQGTQAALNLYGTSSFTSNLSTSATAGSNNVMNVSGNNTFDSSFTGSSGAVYSNILSLYTPSFNGNAAVSSGAFLSSMFAINNIGFNGAGYTIAMTQYGSTLTEMKYDEDEDEAYSNNRAISGLNIYNQISGSNNGTISHLAGLQIMGLYKNGSGTLTATTSSQILINDSNEFGNVLTPSANRYAIYQAGKTDQNYFNGPVILPNSGSTLLKTTGTGTIVGAVAGTDYLAPSSYAFGGTGYSINNGFYMLWGSGTISPAANTGTSTSVSFSGTGVIFPTACVGVQVTLNPPNTTTFTTAHEARAYNPSTTGFTLVINCVNNGTTAATYTYYWFAYGY